MNEFKKSDLRTGMKVMTRKGSEYTYDEKQERFISDGGYSWFYLCDISDDLKCEPLSAFDITEVFEYQSIWQRKPEPKRMTKAEIEAALGYEVEIAPEVKEVERYAKKGEWIVVKTPNDDRFKVDEKYKAEVVIGDGILVLHPDGKCGGKAFMADRTYNVLEGYTP